MRYLEFFEYSAEDLEKLMEKNVKMTEMRKKDPSQYPEYLFPPHNIGGEMKGFSVVEATPEQIMRGVNYWLPELRLKFMPIFENARFIEEYVKSKKQ